MVTRFTGVKKNTKHIPHIHSALDCLSETQDENARLLREAKKNIERLKNAVLGADAARAEREQLEKDRLAGLAKIERERLEKERVPAPTTGAQTSSPVRNKIRVAIPTPCKLLSLVLQPGDYNLGKNLRVNLRHDGILSTTWLSDKRKRMVSDMSVVPLTSPSGLFLEYLGQVPAGASGAHVVAEYSPKGSNERKVVYQHVVLRPSGSRTTASTGPACAPERVDLGVPPCNPVSVKIKLPAGTNPGIQLALRRPGERDNLAVVWTSKGKKKLSFVIPSAAKVGEDGLFLEVHGRTSVARNVHVFVKYSVGGQKKHNTVVVRLAPTEDGTHLTAVSVVPTYEDAIAEKLRGAKLISAERLLLDPPPVFQVLSAFVTAEKANDNIFFRLGVRSGRSKKTVVVADGAVTRGKTTGTMVMQHKTNPLPKGFYWSNVALSATANLSEQRKVSVHMVYLGADGTDRVYSRSFWLVPGGRILGIMNTPAKVTEHGSPESAETEAHRAQRAADPGSPGPKRPGAPVGPSGPSEGEDIAIAILETLVPVSRLFD